MSSFGMNLRFLRNQKKISQYALASELGVAQTHIANLETGRTRPSWPFAQRVAEYFGVALDDLAAEPDETLQPA